MRPILFDVDAQRAQMTVLFPGDPNRIATVKIRGDLTGPGVDPKAVAMREFLAMTPAQLELIEDIAHEFQRPPDPAPRFAMIEKLEQEERYPGPIFCPACCAKLGRGDSPAIGYVDECSGCRRKVVIRFVPGSVTVVLWVDK